jgi:glycine/D-amino acid oxidase-like deaminating enzyme
MRTTPQVVVIGGGIAGRATAWRVARRRRSDLVLPERAEPTSGSTWHAAGGFHGRNGAASMAALQGPTIGVYDELQAESEEALGPHRTGAGLAAGGRGSARVLGRDLPAPVALKPPYEPAGRRLRADIPLRAPSLEAAE